MSFIDVVKNLIRKAIPPYIIRYTYNTDIHAPTSVKGKDYINAYKTMSWVHACVRVIAQTMAAVNWRLYKTSGKEWKEITEHRVLMLFNKPNAFQTRSELFELTSINLELLGEAFWLLAKEENARRIVGLIPLNPTKMELELKDNEPYRWKYKMHPDVMTLELEDVIQFKYPNPDNPYRGLSPLMAGAETADADYYASKFNKNYFFNSANPSGAFTTESKLSNEEFERLKKQVETLYQGVDKAHKAILLEKGMKYEPIQVTHKDMQFLDLRKLARVEIASIFGVPLSKLGISEEVNRATAYINDYTFAKNTIEPKLVLMRESLNDYLLPRFGDNLYFDFDSVIPRDREFELKKYQTYADMGIMTINEIREELGLEPVDWGDRPFNPKAGINLNFEPEEKKETRDLAAEVWKSMDSKSKGIEENLKGWVAARFEKQRKKILDLWDKVFEGSIKSDSLLLSNPPIPERKINDAEFDRNVDKLLGMIFTDEELKIWKSKYNEEFPEWFIYASEEVARRFGLRLTLDPNSATVGDVLMLRSQRFAKQINDTTFKQLKKSLGEGWRLGEGEQELKKRVTQVMTLGKRQRAATISRTELWSAANEAHQMTYQVNGIEYKQWFTALDERVREDHRIAHAQIVKTGEPFTVGGEYLMYPGDPKGSPENIINCRCISTPPPPGW